MSAPIGQAPIPASDRVVTIHQPHYFPWLGFMAKIACADHFIYLDNVQFEKNGWQNRARYSTSEGLKFLSLPILQKGIISEQKQIREVQLADSRAPLKHFKTLQQRYGKCPGWRLLSSRLENILGRPHEKLMSLCQETTQLTLDLYHLKPQITFASDLVVTGQKGERVINLVKAVNANHYLSGTGAREYLVPETFVEAGLGLTFQEFTHPGYHQTTGAAFAPAAFALEWYLEKPDEAVEAFHKHLNQNLNQPVRCRNSA
jgi:hypothetical protein